MEDPKKDPKRDTRTQVVTLRKAGVSATRIAVALDISATRVYQILKEEKASEEASA